MQNQRTSTPSASRRRTFWRSVVRGMAAPALIYGGFSPTITIVEVQSVSPPQRRAGVWQTVGNDLRSAMNKHEQAAS